MQKTRDDVLILPELPELQRMLKLANRLHDLPRRERAGVALEGIAALTEAAAVGAWCGPAGRLTVVAVVNRTAPDSAAASLLPHGVAPLIGKRPALSPTVRLHTQPETQTHEIRSVCAGPAGPSLLIARRARLPFDQRQRTIVQLMHPQLAWALRPTDRDDTLNPQRPMGDLSPKHKAVLDLLLGGKTEKQMASHLAVNPHTVHSRVKQIYRHFGVGSRAQLLARFVSPPKRPI